MLHFLRHECRAAIIPYLEHVINKCGEKRPKLHETLAEQYIVMVKKLMKDYVHVLADSKLQISLKLSSKLFQTRPPQKAEMSTESWASTVKS